MIGRWTDEEGDAWWRTNVPTLIGMDVEDEPEQAPLKLDVDVASRADRL